MKLQNEELLQQVEHLKGAGMSFTEEAERLTRVASANEMDNRKKTEEVPRVECLGSASRRQLVTQVLAASLPFDAHLPLSLRQQQAVISRQKKVSADTGPLLVLVSG